MGAVAPGAPVQQRAQRTQELRHRLAADGGVLGEREGGAEVGADLVAHVLPERVQLLDPALAPEAQDAQLARTDMASPASAP